jgi:hypothetical protein
MVCDEDASGMSITDRLGRVISDEQLEAMAVLERIGYGGVSPEDKRRAVQTLAKRLQECRDLASLHPLIAAAECELEDPEILTWHGRIICRFGLWCLHRQAKRYGDIPGVNDGLMVKWFWTHDMKYVAQMYERALRSDIVGETCRWMLGSVSQSHPLLAQQLERVQRGES